MPYSNLILSQNKLIQFLSTDFPAFDLKRREDSLYILPADILYSVRCV